MSDALQAPLVAALIYDGLCTFEFGIVAEVFGLKRPELGRDLYRFVSVAVEDGPIRAAGGLTVTATGGAQELHRADVIVIPGWRGKDAGVPEGVRDMLRAAHARGARLVSVCSGAFVLAAAGLLDGRAATTHWRYADDLQARFPAVRVAANSLYTDDGGIITSAGSSAGIDACLHIVRCDYGAQVANTVARRLVMHGHRDGGQAQFIDHPAPAKDTADRLSEVIATLRATLAERHDIASMARLAGMSARTFQRRFQGYTGQPAMQWLARERAARMATLLETTALSVEQTGYAAGFTSPEMMRHHFRQVYDIAPGAYRRRFAVGSL